MFELTRNSLQRYFFACIISGLTALTGCATIKDARQTDRSSRPKGSKAAIEAKVGEKSPRSRAAQLPYEQPTETAPYDAHGLAADVPTLAHFLERHLDPALPLTTEDREVLSKVEIPARPGTLHEAILTVAAIKHALHPRPTPARQYEEQDYLNEKPTDNHQNIEDLARAYQLNLLRSLARNPYLQDGRFWEMAVIATQKSTPSAVFVQQLKDMLERRASRWEQLSERAKQLHADHDESTRDQPLSYNKSTLSPADLRSGDALLMQAQTLAEGKNYKDAIAKVLQVQRSSPFYPEAQEKIRIYSNQAVQELRHKAAIAFQSAIPVSDPKAKLEYLEEARDYLQEALTQFPTADQLHTVRENLSVISRDLEQLSSHTE